MLPPQFQPKQPRTSAGHRLLPSRICNLRGSLWPHGAGFAGADSQKLPRPAFLSLIHGDLEMLYCKLCSDPHPHGGGNSPQKANGCSSRGRFTAWMGVSSPSQLFCIPQELDTFPPLALGILVPFQHFVLCFLSLCCTFSGNKGMFVFQCDPSLFSLSERDNYRALH